MKLGSMATRPHRLRAQAFTIAEVMVAVLIMAIAFVSLYAGIFFCFGLTRTEREDLRATQIMLQRMEGIRLFNWFQLTNTTLNPPTFTEQYLPGIPGIPASGVVYTGSVNIAPVVLDPPATYSNDMKELTVSVTWLSGAVQRTRNMTTYVSRNGVQNYVYYIK